MKPSRPSIDFPTYEKESSATAVDESPWFEEKKPAVVPPRPAAGQAPRPGPSVPRPAKGSMAPAPADLGKRAPSGAMAPTGIAKVESRGRSEAAPLDLKKRLPPGYSSRKEEIAPVQTKTVPLPAITGAPAARTTTQPLVIPGRATRPDGAPSFGPDALDPGSVAMIRNINGEPTAPPVVHARPAAVAPPPLPAWAAAPPVVHAPRPIDVPAAAPAWALPGLPQASAAQDRKELPSFGPVAFDLDDHRNAPTTMIRPERSRASLALASAAAGLLLLVGAGKVLVAHLVSDEAAPIAAAAAAPPEAPVVVVTPSPVAEAPALPRLTPEQIFPAATTTSAPPPAKIPAATYKIEKAHMGADIARRNAPVLPFSTRPTLHRETPTVDDLLRTPPVRGEHD